MDIPDDGFKGFENGFRGFPKRLPEDCIEYTLFAIDAKLKTSKEILARLEAVRKESLKLTEPLLKDYIWQRESFKLEVQSEKGRVYLRGITNYGDSVEDEWLIVYILKELSKLFPELWIKAVDTDGEFLLIEAANALPRWLNPEIADNRVWICNNQLRIVPLTVSSQASAKTSPISRSLNLDEALKIITSTPDILINSPLVEEEAFYRIRNYPSQVAASVHCNQIQIPRKLAYILHDRPASIAPAVEAFYLRDPIALKTLDSTTSGLEFMPEDLVTVSTRFTKVLYAQLKSQVFPPPAVWKGSFAQAEKAVAEDEKAFKTLTQLELGMKVACGFEMLIKDPKNGDNRVVRELKIMLNDLRADNFSELPSNEEILKWKDVTRDDDDTWMDINFEDFERELDGKNARRDRSKTSAPHEPDLASGFGDAKTQADLKKMVERFEAFLNDETAGPDGVDLDDMDFDDDEEDDEEESDSGQSEDEDKDVSFDEKEFARMMREMMGMPTEDPDDMDSVSVSLAKVQNGENGAAEERSSSNREDIDEASEMREVMARMEAELNEVGALNLDLRPSKYPALKGKSRETDEHNDSGDESEGDVNIDLNLAKNLLESFKSQAGMSGPGGNMLGMMGIQLPRDDADRDEQIKPSKK